MSQPYLFEKSIGLLTTRERRAFGPWLDGVLNGNQQLVQQMYQLWESGASWEEIPRALGLPSDKAERTLIRLRGRLQEQIERYLIWLAVEKEPLQQQTLLLREILTRQGTYHFPIVQRKLAKNREETSIRDATYHRALHDEALLQQIFWVQHPPNFRKGEDHTAERIQHWLAGTGHELLTLGLIAHSHQRPERRQLDQLIDAYLDTAPSLDAPAQLLRELYSRYRIEAWTEDTLSQDQHLLANMREVREQFWPRDFADLHLLFANYLIQKVRHLPSLGYYDLLTQLYLWSLAEQLWNVNRAIYRNLSNLYSNLIVLSDTSEQQQAYAQQGFAFLAEYQANLAPEEQETAYAYNAANLHFALGQYDQIRVVRLTGQFNDPYYEIGYEFNLLKADLDGGTGVYLEAHFDRLRKRISRAEGLSPKARKGSLNQLSMLHKFKALQYREEAVALVEEMAQTRPLEGRVWLTQKVKKLVKSLPSR